MSKEEEKEYSCAISGMDMNLLNEFFELNGFDTLKAMSICCTFLADMILEVKLSEEGIQNVFENIRYCMKQIEGMENKGKRS